ncbi:MAG TPA: 3-methyl-2-oxobutanoate hydroxymethyltransferase, partial [Candidatus Nitrosotalea sp.]|nr:3-methyl-2-oxobutanoate hydroxymethyltransferase [Candidatus Nitrosotalea sp.]
PANDAAAAATRSAHVNAAKAMPLQRQKKVAVALPRPHPVRSAPRGQQLVACEPVAEEDVVGCGRGRRARYVLGLYEKIKPKFAKRYLELSSEIVKAVESYKSDVTSGKFPGIEHSFSMDTSELEKLEKEIG